MKFRFTAHALERPGQILEQREGRRVLQSKVHLSDGEYLLRVIVDGRIEPPAVVTVYRTRYVAKYWRQE